MFIQTHISINECIVLEHNHLCVHGLCSMVFRWFSLWTQRFFSFLFFSSPHLTSLLSVAIHSEQNTHLNKQQQPIWLSITFSFASAACGRWCCRCCPFHTPTHLYKLYELFWFEFCLSSLHTHSANSSALLHYSFALALTLTYSLLSLCSATLRYVRCAGALACSRMCAFDDFFFSSTQPHRISRPFSLSLCSFLVHVCAFVNKTYPKTAIHRETHTMNKTREKKITGTQMGMGMCACDSRETE